MKLDVNKVKRFAKETDALILPNGLRWAGPPEATENSLMIPYDDLGRSKEGVPYRVSISPNRNNTLLQDK